MKKSDTNEQVLSRRKALGRIGLFATAAYTVPAFATLSMAHASSGVSSVSAVSAVSAVSTASGPSGTGTIAETDTGTGAGTGTGPDPVTVQAVCGLPGDLDYDICLINNGWEGFVAPI